MLNDVARFIGVVVIFIVIFKWWLDADTPRDPQ